MATRAAPPDINPLLEGMRHTPHICFAEVLRSANRSVARHYAQYLAGLDITVAQASMLMRLYYLGETTMAEFAEQMETERTTMVRNIAPLERSGHILQLPAMQGRALRYRLSDKGFATLETALPHWQAAQDALRAQLGDALWASLLGGMRTLVEIEGSACPRTSRPD
ncbi:MAG: transcriptional regulator, MarR family [Bradyrhizobium sp.]|nr:transcriptional regulator, MarR family [Bradyrhizobium sp.]